MTEQRNGSLVLPVSRPVVVAGYRHDIKFDEPVSNRIVSGGIGLLAEPWIAGHSLLMQPGPLSTSISAKSGIANMASVPEHGFTLFALNEPDSRGAKFWAVAWDFGDGSDQPSKLFMDVGESCEWPKHMDVLARIKGIVEPRIYEACHCRKHASHSSIYSNEEG